MLSVAAAMDARAARGLERSICALWMNNLAPDIQEELLHLPPVCSGRDPIHERMCRPICAEHEWKMQRELWRALRPPARPDSSE